MQSLWKRVIEDSIALLKQELQGKQMPTVLENEYVLWQGKLRQTKPRYVPNTENFVFMHLIEIEKLPSYIALLDYLEASPIVKKFYEGRLTDKDGKVVKEPRFRNLLETDFTMQFLGHYFDRKPIRKFDPQRFQRIYASLEDYVYGEQEHVYFAPLLLFSGDSDIYRINDKLKIRRISPQDFSTLFSNPIESPGIPYGSKYGLEYVAEYAFGEQKDPIDAFEFLVKALRLFDTGSVSVSTVLKKRLPHFGTMFISAVLPNSRLTFFGKPFRLTKKELNKFRKFFNHLKSYHDLLDKELATSVRRFNSAIEHLNDDDKIIDFMISIEAMYTADYKYEMSFRVASRVANLLGLDDKDSHFLNEFMKKAYDNRSTLVHGGKFKIIEVDGKSYNAPLTAEVLEKIARRSIRKFLNLYLSYRNRDDINKALNEMIVTKLGRSMIRKNAKGVFD